MRFASATRQHVKAWLGGRVFPAPCGGPGTVDYQSKSREKSDAERHTKHKSLFFCDIQASGKFGCNFKKKIITLSTGYLPLPFLPNILYDYSEVTIHNITH